MSYQGFILSSTQLTRNNATRLVFQGRLSDGRRFHWTVTQPRIVFFINRDQDLPSPGTFRKQVELRNLRGEAVDALYFRKTVELNQVRTALESRKILTCEADINPVARFLMEHYVQGGVAFESEPVNEKNNMV